MATNREWLYSLEPSELSAWFDAEHVENQERTLDGDIAPENADSRELLGADVRKWCGKYAYQADMVWTWLNRQVAITSNAMRGKIAELTAERDKLQEQLLIGWECECRLQAERERYREKFGKCLDYADAIHALMDDEGLA